MYAIGYSAKTLYKYHGSVETQEVRNGIFSENTIYVPWVSGDPGGTQWDIQRKHYICTMGLWRPRRYAMGYSAKSLYIYHGSLETQEVRRVSFRSRYGEESSTHTGCPGNMGWCLHLCTGFVPSSRVLGVIPHFYGKTQQG
ncbi:hypothetical protein BaRGS_00038788 [Batillaria attramentaria]|uniref:Uncharacterized protein n=1 Tax=Batillaria attramentaria TaxID=370345 RepID=A0ABD0J531_9CAEN